MPAGKGGQTPSENTDPDKEPSGRGHNATLTVTATLASELGKHAGMDSMGSGFCRMPDEARVNVFPPWDQSVLLLRNVECGHRTTLLKGGGERRGKERTGKEVQKE